MNDQKYECYGWFFIFSHPRDFGIHNKISYFEWFNLLFLKCFIYFLFLFVDSLIIISLLVLLLQTSNGVYCLDPKVRITMERVFTSKASEESFSIHSGTSIYGIRVYNQPTIYYSGSYTWETCLYPDFYTIHLKDSKKMIVGHLVLHWKYI